MILTHSLPGNGRVRRQSIPAADSYCTRPRACSVSELRLRPLAAEGDWALSVVLFDASFDSLLISRLAVTQQLDLPEQKICVRKPILKEECRCRALSRLVSWLEGN